MLPVWVDFTLLAGLLCYISWGFARQFLPAFLLLFMFVLPIYTASLALVLPVDLSLLFVPERYASYLYYSLVLLTIVIVVYLFWQLFKLFRLIQFRQSGRVFGVILSLTAYLGVFASLKHLFDAYSWPFFEQADNVILQYLMVFALHF